MNRNLKKMSAHFSETDFHKWLEQMRKMSDHTKLPKNETELTELYRSILGHLREYYSIVSKMDYDGPERATMCVRGMWYWTENEKYGFYSFLLETLKDCPRNDPHCSTCHFTISVRDIFVWSLINKKARKSIYQ